MGFFDDLMTELSWVEDATHPDFVQALQGMLGDEEQPGIGLPDLLERLRAAGLGGVVQSWVNEGTSMPIAPDQIAGALGDDQAQAMATRAGMAPERFLEALAEHVPGLIERLSRTDQLRPGGAGATSTV